MTPPVASRPVPVALSLGSNMGNRASYLERARTYLVAGGLVKILRASPVYETEPVQCPLQRWFLNQALWVETALPPQMLLSFCQRVEYLLGRRRSEWHGPRTVDIDILSFGDLVLRSPALTLPHSALPLRRSILQPMADLGMVWRHPLLGADVPALLARCPDQSRVMLA